MNSQQPVRPEGEWQPPMLRARPGQTVVEGSGHVGACVVSCVVSGLAAAVASWWLIGDQSHSRFPGDLDYAFRAPTVPHWVVPTFGPIAFASGVVVFGLLIVGVTRRTVDRRWLTVAFACALAGFLFALTGRTESAGTVGANIGGGIAVFFFGPIVVALVGWATVAASGIARRRESADVAPAPR